MTAPTEAGAGVDSCVADQIKSARALIRLLSKEMREDVCDAIAALDESTAELERATGAQP